MLLGHKSSFDQLIFTYWKRPTQLSKQLFHCVAISFFFYGFFLFHCLCLCHPTPPPPPSLSLCLSLYISFVPSLLFYTFFLPLCLPLSSYITPSLQLCVAISLFSFEFVLFHYMSLSLSLSICLTVSISLSMSLFYVCLVSISVFPPLSHFFNLGPMNYDLFYTFISLCMSKHYSLFLSNCI